MRAWVRFVVFGALGSVPLLTRGGWVRFVILLGAEPVAGKKAVCHPAHFRSGGSSGETSAVRMRWAVLRKEFLRPDHSSRSATRGSRPAALRPGIQHASAVIAKNSAAMARYVTGSEAFTPTSIVDITRVSPSAARISRPIRLRSTASRVRSLD